MLLSLIFLLLANAVAKRRENKKAVLIVFIVLLYSIIVEYGWLAAIFIGNGVSTIKELCSSTEINIPIIIYLVLFTFYSLTIVYIRKDITSIFKYFYNPLYSIASTIIDRLIYILYKKLYSENLLNNSDFRIRSFKKPFNGQIRSFSTAPSYKDNYKKDGKICLSVSTSSTKPTVNKNVYGDDDDLNIRKQTIYFDYSPIYAILKNIIEDNSKSTLERQQEIEEFMSKTWISLAEKIKDDMRDNKITSKSFKIINEYIKDYITNLEEALNKLTKRRLSKEKKAVYSFLYELDLKDISATVLNRVIPIITRPDGVKYNEFIISLGELVHRLYLSVTYEQYKNKIISAHKKLNKKLDDSKAVKENTKYMTFKEFIADKKLGADSFGAIGEFLTICFLELEGLIDKKLVNIKNTNKQEAILYPLPEAVTAFENAFNVIGFKLPMIHKPIEWTAKQYGGYLLNKEKYNEELIHKNNISGDLSLTNNSIYNQVNYMSSVSYKINNEMYDFISNYGLKHELVIKSLHIDTDNYKDLSDNNKAEVISHNSRYFQERNILGLASLFRNVDRFYIPLYFDWRGRIYNDVPYLNYQSISLAKALIMFEEGDNLNQKDIESWKDFINKTESFELPKDNFFYWLSVYGANCFGSGCLSSEGRIYKKGLDKLSYDDRVRWVIDHHKQIMEMDEALWSIASDPLLFVAFCIEYRNIFNGKQTKTYLPIQLDASCNGLQHLSVMSANSNLAKLVNLMPNDYNGLPYDLYSIVLNEIIKKIDKLVENKKTHYLLKTLKLDRAIVKRSIMTIPYNVTVHGVVEHLQEFFTSEWKDKNLLYIPKDKKHGENHITQSDLFALATIIKSTLFEMHPELNDLIDYFKNMVDVFNKLNLPIIWKTPTGLEIKQLYVKTESARIRTGLRRNNGFSVQIPTDKISKGSQKNSFMPNLIHSMDAATITKLIPLLKKVSLRNIYTIHDCFATTACCIPQLNVLVRESFISIYADKSFVKSLHKFFLEYILGNFDVKYIYNIDGLEHYEIFNKGSNVELDNVIKGRLEVIVSNNKTISIPPLPKIDELTDLRTNIRKAIYKIG